METTPLDIPTKIKSLVTPRVIVLIAAWLLVVIGMTVYYKAAHVISGRIPWTGLFAIFTLDAVFGYFVATILVVGGELVGRLTDRFGSSRFTPLQTAALRYVASAVFGVVAVTAATYGWFTLLFGFPTSADFLIDMTVLSIGLPLFINGLLETFHYQGAWQAERYEKEAAAREALLAEFEALRNQVSPHFLFNSFTTLSQMIQEAPDRASGFVDDLSDVFRYVLQNRDSDSVALSDELNAVRALLQVHQARVPNGLHVSITIDDNAASGKIPPMALYTLVENALKHNVISAEQPLTINIRVDRNKMLVVENTLQPRRTRHSLGTGLKNLDRRFQLVLHQGLNVERADGKFIVRAPLILGSS